MWARGSPLSCIAEDIPVLTFNDIEKVSGGVLIRPEDVLDGQHPAKANGSIAGKGHAGLVSKLLKLLRPLRDESPELLNEKQAAAFVGIGRTKWSNYQESGRVPLPIRLAGKRWRKAELQAWVEQGCPPENRWKYRPTSSSKK